MRNFFSTIIIAVLAVMVMSTLASAQLKIAYINSEKIKAEYKEAQDAETKIAEINAQWEKEAMDKQKEIQALQEQLESQSLLLSEEKKREKYQELQNMAMSFEQFKQQKWGQRGEINTRLEELWKPIQDKIFAQINQIGEDEGYDYIFDSALNVILYIGKGQTDLTDRVIEELNKGITTSK